PLRLQTPYLNTGVSDRHLLQDDPGDLIRSLCDEIRFRFLDLRSAPVSVQHAHRVHSGTPSSFNIVSAVSDHEHIRPALCTALRENILDHFLFLRPAPVQIRTSDKIKILYKPEMLCDDPGKFLRLGGGKQDPASSLLQPAEHRDHTVVDAVLKDSFLCIILTVEGHHFLRLLRRDPAESLKLLM